MTDSRDFFAELESHLHRAASRQARLGRIASAPVPRASTLLAATAAAGCIVLALTVVAGLLRGTTSEEREASPAAVSTIAANEPRECGDEHERAPSLTDAPPAQTILERFGVFRRPAKPGAPPAEDWLSLATGPTYIGVHGGWSRKLGEHDGTLYFAAPVADIPQESVGRTDDCARSPEYDPDAPNQRPGICLVYVTSDGRGGACHTVTDIGNGLVIWPAWTAATRKHAPVTWHGLVPDGVTHVTFEQPDGTRVTGAVNDNLVVVTLTVDGMDRDSSPRIFFRDADGHEREVGHLRYTPEGMP